MWAARDADNQSGLLLYLYHEPTFFPLMFGVQYLNYQQTQASYKGGGATDSHSVTLSPYQRSALNAVQYLKTAQIVQFILLTTKEAVKFD